MFGPAAGLLWYVAAVAERGGASVHRHSWSHEPPDPFEPAVERWVRGEVAPVLDAVGGSPLVIAKSLGTNAATLAAERALPAVWLTPLLTTPWVAAALGRATAPFLVVAGAWPTRGLDCSWRRCATANRQGAVLSQTPCQLDRYDELKAGRRRGHAARAGSCPGTFTPRRYNGRGHQHGREQASSDRPPPEEDEHRRNQQAKPKPYPEGPHPRRPRPVA